MSNQCQAFFTQTGEQCSNKTDNTLCDSHNEYIANLKSELLELMLIPLVTQELSRRKQQLREQLQVLEAKTKPARRYTHGIYGYCLGDDFCVIKPMAIVYKISTKQVVGSLSGIGYGDDGVAYPFEPSLLVYKEQADTAFIKYGLTCDQNRIATVQLSIVADNTDPNFFSVQNQ